MRALLRMVSPNAWQTDKHASVVAGRIGCSSVAMAQMERGTRGVHLLRLSIAVPAVLAKGMALIRVLAELRLEFRVILSHIRRRVGVLEVEDFWRSFAQLIS